MVNAVSCSCGDVLRSEDEEVLYAFARAHAVRAHHPMPFQPANPLFASREEEQRAIVQRWEVDEQIVEDWETGEEPYVTRRRDAPHAALVGARR